MKTISTTLLILLFTVTIAEAQLRKDLSPSDDFSGSVTHTQNPSSFFGNWMNQLNMTMSHSYSMNFSNFGGQMQNLNAYTNSMFFDVSDKVDAQLDVSVLHSPFGNSFMNNQNSLGSQIVIDRARVDYKISPNTRLSIEFSNNPYYSPYNRFGTGNMHYDRRYSPWY